MQNSLFATVILVAATVTVIGCKKPDRAMRAWRLASCMPASTEVFPIRHFGRGMQGG